MSIDSERKDSNEVFSLCGPMGPSGGTVCHGRTDERPTVKGYQSIIQ